MGYFSNLLLVSTLLLVCIASVSTYTPTNGPPRSSAIITDGTNTCGGVFINSAFVLTTSSCAATLDYSSTVTITPLSDSSVTYFASSSNPSTFGSTTNGVSLIRLICPGVLPSQVAAGTVRFAEVATAAFEANSCLPQGTVSTLTQFAGISQTGSVLREPVQNIDIFSLQYVGQCSLDGFEASSTVDSNDTSSTSDDIFNCFNATEDPLEGSGVYVQDQNRFREIVVGLVQGRNQDNFIAAVRVSQFAAQLGRFIADDATGKSLSAERQARFQRQQAIRIAIQSGLRPATLPDSSSSSPAFTSVDSQTARRIVRNQQEAFFMETFTHSNWHQHTDGMSSIFSADHLQARLESKHRRAPDSAFDCPNAIPGCAAA